MVPLTEVVYIWVCWPLCNWNAVVDFGWGMPTSYLLSDFLLIARLNDGCGWIFFSTIFVQLFGNVCNLCCRCLQIVVYNVCDLKLRLVWFIAFMDRSRAFLFSLQLYVTQQATTPLIISNVCLEDGSCLLCKPHFFL